MVTRPKTRCNQLHGSSPPGQSTEKNDTRPNRVVKMVRTAVTARTTSPANVHRSDERTAAIQYVITSRGIAPMVTCTRTGWIVTSRTKLMPGRSASLVPRTAGAGVLGLHAVGRLQRRAVPHGARVG